MVTEARVWQALKKVIDPEYPLSIVDLGMIYKVKVLQAKVAIEMTFTAMGCPAIDMILLDVDEEVRKISGVKNVEIEIVWSPPWTRNKITPAGREILQYYGVGV
ncbi:metal-sulfur cluster assembly factor [candidate division KSB1 bacterium]|nr:metal-sulfur cluster assembly factor [candidate division KSB1 bacterium]